MSLVLRYKFNGSTSSLTTDSSGNSNTLTNDGGVVSAVDATYGNVASFSNAAGSNLVIAPSPAALTGSSSKTICFWFKRNDENASFQHFFGSSPTDSQYRLQIHSVSLMRTIMLLPTGESAINTSYLPGFLTGVWYHAAITYDGTTEVVYVDGSQQTSTARSMLVGGDSFTIGGSPSFTTNYRLDGFMSDFRVYDDALSATEIGTLYTDGPNPPVTVIWVLDANSKYEVSSREHMIQIMHDGAIYNNTGDVPSNQWGAAHYIQTADIDLLGDSTNIRPMGFSSNWTGEYDGNGFTVSNWVYVEPSPITTSSCGFFTSINNGTVKNFRLAGVCSISGFGDVAGFICDTAFGTSTLSNIEVDLSPGSFITQSSTETSGNTRVGTVFGRLESSGPTTGITFKGQLDSITLALGTNVSTAYVGGLIGWLKNSTGTNTLFRNLGTFPGGLTGTRVGGVIGKMDASNLTKVLNAMTGDLIETTRGSFVGGVIGELIQHNSSQVASEFVNSMKGNITGTTTNSWNGGIIGGLDQETGSTIHSLFNYMTGDIVNTFNANRASGLVAFGIGSPNLTTSINAMNGSVRFPTTGFPSSGVESNIDLSFGLTYVTDRNITTTPITGLPTDPGTGLPVFDLTATDPGGFTHTFEFVFGNLPREFNQLRIESSGEYMNFSELEIIDTSGTNIALLGTADGTGGGHGGPSLGNDGGTEHAYNSDPLVNTVVDMYASGGPVFWAVNLNRAYTLMEINKVIFYNRSGGVESARASGATVSFHSADGGAPEQVGVLTSDLVQEFVFNPLLPEFIRYNQLQINLSGENLQMAELEIRDLNGVNIARLGTASSTDENPLGPATNAIDGNTDPIFSTDSMTNSISISLQVNNVATWTLDLDRGYTLSEINKVIFYNRDDSIVSPWATGGVITFHSADGATEQVGVLTSDLVQEFVLTTVLFLATSSVTSISATVVEVAGDLTYQITKTVGDTTSITHTGISAGNFTIDSLTPETTYVLQLYADTGDGYSLRDTKTVTTLANTGANYDINVYRRNGKFDLSGLDSSSFSLLENVINDVFTTGDKLEIKLGSRTPSVAFVKVGEAVSTDDSILVPFNSTGGSGQTITMNLSDNSTVSVTYDDINDSLAIGGATVRVGESIVVDGKKLTVEDL